MGRPSVNHFGAVNSFPSLDKNTFPFQNALTPSSFSDIQYPVGFIDMSQFSASRRPGLPFVEDLGFGIVGIEVDVRADSYSVPRRMRRCLQVLRFDGPGWLRQAGHVQ